jgi:polyisoprenyl-phosphate glycosyltransferase
LGEYISTIFDETKKHPKFIRTLVRKGDRTYKTAAEISALVQERRSKYRRWLKPNGNNGNPNIYTP